MINPVLLITGIFLLVVVVIVNRETPMTPIKWVTGGAIVIEIVRVTIALGVQ